MPALPMLDASAVSWHSHATEHLFYLAEHYQTSVQAEESTTLGNKGNQGT